MRYVSVGGPLGFSGVPNEGIRIITAREHDEARLRGKGPVPPMTMTVTLEDGTEITRSVAPKADA